MLEPSLGLGNSGRQHHLRRMRQAEGDGRVLSINHPLQETPQEKRTHNTAITLLQMLEARVVDRPAWRGQ